MNSSISQLKFWVTFPLIILLVIFNAGCFQQINKNLTIDEAKRSYYDGNFARSFRLTEVLALKDDAHAQYALGYMYYYGVGAPQNKPLGIAWIKKAAEQGCAPAFAALQQLSAVHDIS